MATNARLRTTSVSHDGAVQCIPYPTWRKRFAERLQEPLTLNVASLLVLAFGSTRSKIDFDLIRRRHYAYGLLDAADRARSVGLRSVTVAEFGVAGGDGLLNLCEIAGRISSEDGIDIRVVGFDTGKGMPPPLDFRDHPDLYQAGDFPMDQAGLIARLPRNGQLILGDLQDTIPEFAAKLLPDSPLGFAAIDVDYYSSAMQALNLFADADPRKYLPVTTLYFDDITHPTHSRFTGELLAVDEFNHEHSMRKIDADRFLRWRRIFKHAAWIDQIFLLHVLDHPAMTLGSRRAPKVYQPSPDWHSTGQNSGD